MQVRPTGAGWRGAQVVRVGASTLVLPLAALPALGRTLDPGAFDVTAGGGAAPPTVRSRLEAGDSQALRTVRLRIRVLDAGGAPAPQGDVTLGNTDSAARYTGLLVLEGADQQVTVPVGHYSAAALVPGSGRERIVTRSDLDVQQDGQLLVLDARDATVRPAITTPQPAHLDTPGAVWARTDALGRGGFGFGLTGAQVSVAPAPAARTGTLDWSTTWSLSGQRSSSSRPYTYDAIFSDHGIPRDQQHRPAAGAFADVRTRYHASGGHPEQLLLGRLPFAPGQTFAGGFLTPLRAPLVRDEHVLAPQGGFWATDVVQLDRDGGLAVDWLDNPVATYRPGQQAVVDWLRPARLPRVLDDGISQLDCGACRHGDRLDLGVAAADSEPGHVGLPVPGPAGAPTTRLRLFQGRTLLADVADGPTLSAQVAAAGAQYRLVVDTDLPAATNASATSSHSEITFGSAHGAGPTCDSGGAACRVLPLLQVRAALPVDLLGQLPLGGAAAELAVTHVRGAARADVREVTVSVRTGTSAWQQLPAVLRPDGSVRVTLPGPRAQAGRWVDLRVTARDSLGGTLEQTLVRAYRISGP